MKVVILAGGLGTRLSEETEIRPKPMVEIGSHPILWHIMRHYAFYNHNEFFIALGYKGEVIRRYFLDYHYMSHESLTVELSTGKVEMSGNDAGENWIVHLPNTGQLTNTGGRIKRMKPWLHNETFMMTYGDGVSSVNLDELLRFHKERGCIATMTAVRPSARFGTLELENNAVVSFVEKSQIKEGWINGGFFVFEPAIFDYIEGDETVMEADVLEQLASEGQLAAYLHDGFWQCMDTLRDKRFLESLWQSGGAPWKLW
jgi:glucose-1-phosphate cytidylyltransferase